MSPRNHPSTFVHEQDLPSISVNILCICRTFCQFSIHLWGLLSTSVSCWCSRRAFRQHSVYPWDHPSTFCASAGLSVNFLQLPVHPRTIRQLQSTIPVALGPFVNFSCIGEPSVNFLCVNGIFHQLLVRPRDLPSTFCAAVGPSVNFSQLSMPPCGLRSTFCAAAGLSVNIPCGRRTIGKLFLRPWDIPSIFVNFLCVHRTLRQFYIRP